MSERIFRENERLIHNGLQLEINELLSSGLTGEVYSGRLEDNEQGWIRVVVKVMKDLDFPLARELFYKEGETLSFLMYEEEINKDRLNETLKIAPRYYGLGEYSPSDSDDFQPIPYLVMEFISGIQMSDLLDSKGPLPEKDVVIAGWHLYRMFDILHVRLKKTFIDLKWENLWWEKTEDKWGGQLRLTDFGTLEDIKEEQARGIARDILLGGVYLLAMATGKMLHYGLGELYEPAAPVIKSHSDVLTWGMRKLLTRLLHRNPAARFDNAADVLKELRFLAVSWTQPAEQLRKNAERYFGKAEAAFDEARSAHQALSQDGLSNAQRALAIFDILRVREPQFYQAQDIEALAQSMRNVLEFGDYLSRGRALLDGRSFASARDVLENGMHYADDPAPLRRWLYVVQMGEEVSPAVFERYFPKIKSILDFVNGDEDNSQRWSSAVKDLENLRKQLLDNASLNSSGLNNLIKECTLYARYEQAQEKYLKDEFKDAVRLYKDVESLLNELPESYREQIENEIGAIELKRRAGEAQVRQEESLSLYKRVRDLLQKMAWKDAVDVCKSAYETYRPVKDETFHIEQIEVLIRQTFDLLHEHHEYAEGAWYAASQMGVLIGENALTSAHDAKFIKAARYLAPLKKALQDYDGVRYGVFLKKIYEELKEHKNFVEDFAQIAAQRADAADENVFLTRLSEVVEELFPESDLPNQWQETALEIAARKTRQIKEQIDDILQRVHRLIVPIFPEVDASSSSLPDAFDAIAKVLREMPSFELLALSDIGERLRLADVLLERAKSLLPDDQSFDFEREQITKLSQDVKKSLDAIPDLERSHREIWRKERKARVQRLKNQYRKIRAELDWVHLMPKGADETVRKSVVAPLQEKLAEFLLNCYLAQNFSREDVKSYVDSDATEQSLPEDIDDDVDDIVALNALREWAQRSLDALGAAGWKKVQSVAQENIRPLEADFAQVQRAFAEGDIALVAKELDRLEKEYHQTQEWQDLKSQLVRAKAWEAWCTAHIPENPEMDDALLQDLRTFPKIGLPLIYWEKSPASTYLKTLARKQKKFLASRLGDWRLLGDDFFQQMVAYAQIAWTRRIVERKDASSADAQKFDVEQWLRNIYQLAKNGDEKEKFFDAIEGAAFPDDPGVVLGEAQNIWQRMQQKDKKSHKEAQRRRKKIIWIVSTLLVVLLLCSTGAVLLRQHWGDVVQVVNGTYTPTPTMTLTPTLTPTPTGTPTMTPTVTFTPTPVPPSNLLLDADAVDTIKPAVPVHGDAYWLLPVEQVTLQTAAGDPESVWQKKTTMSGNTVFYANSGDADVTWHMDTPFDSDGVYALYVLDAGATQDNLDLSSGQFEFQVLLNGEPVPPYRGLTSGIFWNSKESKTKDRWQSIGMYQAAPGDTLTVSLHLANLSKEMPFSVGPLLIVRLDAASAQMLDVLTAGRTLVSLLDDTQSAVSVEVNGNLVPVGKASSFYPKPFSGTMTWQSSFSSVLLSPDGTPSVTTVAVNWNAVDRLPAGKYEVYAWIPAEHATAAGEYKLVVDGQPVKRENPATVEQSPYSDEWVSLGVWTLDDEASVGLQFVVPRGSVGEIGIDAIAILRVEE